MCWHNWLNSWKCEIGISCPPLQHRICCSPGPAIIKVFIKLKQLILLKMTHVIEIHDKNTEGIHIFIPIFEEILKFSLLFVFKEMLQIMTYYWILSEIDIHFEGNSSYYCWAQVWENNIRTNNTWILGQVFIVFVYH